jgi:metal-dependent amidase/aminoacylase/carboxypeptidase family protein
MRDVRARQGHTDPRTWDTVDPLDAVCEAIAETGGSLEDVRPAAVPVDWRLLRGIPAIGRGVRGVVPGTQPGGRLAA